MDLTTLLKRPEVFREFLIDSKINCYSKLTEKNEFPDQFSSSFSCGELYPSYKLKWENLKHIVKQEVFLNREVIWSLKLNGRIVPVIESDLQKIKHTITQAMLSQRKNIIPARGPLIARIGDYEYSSRATEFVNEYDEIFNFNISEKLRRKSDKQIVYTAEVKGRLLLEEKA